MYILRDWRFVDALLNEASQPKLPITNHISFPNVFNIQNQHNFVNSVGITIKRSKFATEFKCK